MHPTFIYSLYRSTVLIFKIKFPVETEMLPVRFVCHVQSLPGVFSRLNVKVMTAAGIQESHDAGHIRAKKSAGNESQFGPLTKNTY